MDKPQGKNINFAARDVLVMKKIGMNLELAINRARNYHGVNSTKLTHKVEKILAATKEFYNFYDLKDVDVSTGINPLPESFFDAVKSEGYAGKVKVTRITRLVRERYLSD